jgi:hypothetical protein
MQALASGGDDPVRKPARPAEASAGANSTDYYDEIEYAGLPVNHSVFIR